MGSVPNLSVMVQAFLNSCGLFPGTTPVVVGVSGGVDSMVLLHLVAVALKFNVTAVHVNYGKRGQDSEADEHLVRSYCSRHGIPLEIMDAQRDGLEATPSGNFQDHARNIRRRFLRSVMVRKNAAAIVLAHHRDDQIETIVQKIWRGAAIENWEGMRRMDMPWIRPLLDVPKSDLITFADSNRIPYRIDTSNLESEYARNMLRNDIFPKLEHHFPGWQQNILRLSDFGSVHRALLDHVTDEVTDAEALNRPRWLSLSASLRIPVARHWVQRVAGHVDWSRGSVSRLSDLLHLQTGGKCSVSDRLTVMRDRSRFVIMASRTKAGWVGDYSSDPVSDMYSGSVPADRFSIIIRLKVLPDETGEPAIYAGHSFVRSVYRPDQVAGVLQLRWEALAVGGAPNKGSESEEELILRHWKKGDRIRPFGMSGDQSVADHLTNRKILASQKSHSLVLTSYDGIIHAVIFPHSLKNGEIGTIAEHTRCHSAGQQVLLIKKLGIIA